jgi:CheY-like chemotaxis protein
MTGRRVLLVDDDMRNLFALSKVLRSWGLVVTMAQDGQKALKTLADDEAPELVLMDIMMPVMDGYDTMRAIRAQARFARLPIIALTAKAMRGDREKCIEAGASDYLSKPIDIDKLASMIRVWLQR